VHPGIDRLSVLWDPRINGICPPSVWHAAARPARGYRVLMAQGVESA
jgi:hypothetical protein